MTKKSNFHPPRRSNKSPRPTFLLVLGGIAVLALLVLVGVAFTLAPASNSGGTPKLQVSAERLDFGNQIFNHPVHASFTVQNTGTGTLTLQVPRSTTLLEGCWPPALVVGQTTLRSGESTTISTDFTMHEGMGGAHLFEIPLTTNDPTQPFTKLQIASNWQAN